MMKANRDVRTNPDGLARLFYTRWSRDTDISETQTTHWLDVFDVFDVFMEPRNFST